MKHYIQHSLRLHPSHQLPMRNAMITVSLLALGVLLAWAMPSIPAAHGVASYLPLHTLLETIAIIIAALVFSVGWNANIDKLSGNLMLLACAFTGVGLLDFSHVLSYTGMPDFVTESSPAKAINFWLAARALAACALFVVAVTPWRPLASTRTRYVLMTTVLVLTAFIYWLFLFHDEILPQTFIPGKGLTAFKINAEYTIIGINIVTAVALWIRMSKPQPFNAAALFSAVCVMALSEFFFTLYANVTDIFNLLGHIYKVISYFFIYRAIFVVAIEDPYRRLKASQNQLQATLDALPDLLFEIDRDGYYCSYHSPRTSLPVTPAEEFIGQSLFDTLPADAVNSVKTALREADENGHATGEYKIKTPQGKRWWNFSVVKKTVDANQQSRFIVLSRDVSERRQIEEANIRLAERLELATSSAYIGIWDWDIVGNILTWDDRMFELYGLQKTNPGIDHDAWLATLHADDRANTEEAIQLALNNIKPYDIEFRIQWQKNQYRHIKAMAHVVHDEQGVPLRMIGVSYDVTRRKEVEATLTRINEELEQRVQQRTTQISNVLKQAEQANAAKSEFLSRMSHELRTPLNAILGFGQLLEINTEQPLTNMQSDQVKEILSAGNHLLELINEVLDLSRIESGRLDLDLKPVVIAPLIESCVAQLLPLARARHINSTLELNKQYVVMADQMRLKEILFNLLSNAIKYNREGGSIQINCTPANDNHLRISVHDTGHGIAADSLLVIFNPFERLQSAYEGIEGTGIGLALVKKLVTAMHGKTGVDSVEGEGSTFWFELPLAETEELPISRTTICANAVTENVPYRILYIEDNLANLRLMHKIMSSRDDIELLDANNAETGLEIATRQPLDLILLDINLPGMDGFTALQQLRNNNYTQNIPVIAVTANAMLKDVEKGIKAGFTDYLTKPLDIPRLMELLDTLLKK